MKKYKTKKNARPKQKDGEEMELFIKRNLLNSI